VQLREDADDVDLPAKNLFGEEDEYEDVVAVPVATDGDEGECCTVEPKIPYIAVTAIKAMKIAQVKEALTARDIDFSSRMKVAALKDVLIAFEGKREAEDKAVAVVRGIVDRQKARHMGLGTFLPFSSRFPHVFLTFSSDLLFIGELFVSDPRGRCLMHSILRGIGECTDYDEALCDRWISKVSETMCDPDFKSAVIPLLSIAYIDYAEQYLLKNTFKVNHGAGIKNVPITSLEGYADLLRARYGPTNEVVMYPELGMVGFPLADMFNINIEVYTPDCVIKERYFPVRKQSREPLLVTLQYKFGKGSFLPLSSRIPLSFLPFPSLRPLTFLVNTHVDAPDHFDLFMKVYCACRRPNALSVRHGDPMTQCANLAQCVGGEWFHQGCLGFNDAAWEAAKADDDWICPFCPAA
jgi:hypothetical protein